MIPEKTHLYKDERRERDFDEIPAYRKKSKTASTSDSRRRSKHKHVYEKIILHWGGDSFEWSGRCEICGRIDNGYKASAWGGPDFKVSGDGTGCWEDICLNDIHARYPQHTILTLKDAEWREWIPGGNANENY